MHMSKTIETIPADIRDRFKALKVIYDEQNSINDQEEEMYRILEIKYDKLYQEVYEQRRRVLLGEVQPPADLL